MPQAETYQGDTSEADQSPPYQGDTTEASEVAPSPASRPTATQPRFVIPDASQKESQRKLPPLNLGLAYKTIEFYQVHPEFLANPLTTHAANAHLSQASKIIGMNMQLERVAIMGETAKAKNMMGKQVGTSLLKLAESGPEGAKVASKWYAVDEDGKPLYENPANWSNILTDYQAHTVSPKMQSPTGKVVLDRDTLVQRYGEDSEQVSQFDKQQSPLSETKKPVADTLTFADGKKVNVVYGPSGAPTVIKDGKEADDAAQKALQQVATSDLLDARKGIHKASTVPERESALKAYDSAKRNFDTVFGIQKPGATPPSPQPSAAPPTNTPNTSVKRFKWTPEGLVPQ